MMVMDLLYKAKQNCCVFCCTCTFIASDKAVNVMVVTCMHLVTSYVYTE